MDEERIGKFIAEVRKQVGLTQKELAEKIGVSDKTISKWECGKSIPDIFYLDALCSSLNISVNELISGKCLTETDYSNKAEENIMALIKENEKIRKKSVVKYIVGIVLVIVTFFLMIACNKDGWGGIIAYFIDVPTLILLVLISVAEVLLANKKSYADILNLLQKTSIPNGVLITATSLVIVMQQIEDMSYMCKYFAVCVIAIIYSVIEYLVVSVLRQHTSEKN